MFYIGALLGFIGFFKYVFYRVVIDIFHQFKEVIGESLKQKGNLTVIILEKPWLKNYLRALENDHLA